VADCHGVGAAGRHAGDHQVAVAPQRGLVGRLIRDPMARFRNTVSSACSKSSTTSDKPVVHHHLLGPIAAALPTECIRSD
jgi:hypothetical protein